IAGGLVAIVISFLLILLSIPFGGAKAFGMGDVKMIVLIGFVVGLPSVIVGIFIGTFVAAAFALVAILTRMRKRTDYIPHGPFLAIGAIIALFWGSSIWHSYTGYPSQPVTNCGRFFVDLPSRAPPSFDTW